MTRYLPDRFTLALLSTVLLASVLPARGAGVPAFSLASNLAISLLFFLHGARLSRQATIAGLKQPRLHALVLGTTFLLFPVLGLGLLALMPGLLTPQLWLGVLFVCTLSSTVQSSIAFTSVARGNVPAAICAATASNLAGIVLTPILVGLLLHVSGSGNGWADAGRIVAQLLLPFLAGQVLRPWIAGWAMRHTRLLGFVDRGAILLAVYSAFGEAVTHGVWQLVPPYQLALLALVNAVLLAAVLLITTMGSRALGFGQADEIAIVFCGSKKSLASGIPMAAVLFGAGQAGIMLLPIMLFHQMQLMVCAFLARRYAEAGVAQPVLAPAE
jgi:sodium/bile acid cotransporter 7